MKPLFYLFMISFLAKDANGQKTSRLVSAIATNSANALQPTAMNIQWRMYDRFDPLVDYNETGRFTMGYDRLGHQYINEYANPTGWNVELLIKENPKAHETPFFKYVWIINGLENELGQHLNFHFTTISAKDGLRAVLSTKSVDIVNNSYRTIARVKNGTNQVGPINLNPPTPAATFDSIPQLPSLGIYSVDVLKKYNNSSRDTTTLDHQHFIITLKDYLVVVLGDSFNSGEGNPDQIGKSGDECWCRVPTITHIVNSLTGDDLDMDEPALWLERKGHRSLQSGAVLAAGLLEKSDPHSSVTLIDLATSGAKIDRGLLFPQHCEWQLTGQIDEVKRYIRDRNIDFLLLSIGINDVGGENEGVGDLITAAADPKPPKFTESDTYFHALSSLPEIPGKFDLLNNKLKQILKIKNVLLIQVPVNIFRDGANNIRSTNQGLLRFLEIDDVRKIDALAFKVAADQKLAAAKYNWIYVDKVTDAFLGHGYFKEYTNDSWFVQAEESCANQGDWNGLVHPNNKGHARIRDMVFDKIKLLTVGPYSPVHTE